MRPGVLELGSQGDLGPDLLAMYAAYLHTRLSRGWWDVVPRWWPVGLVVIAVCYIGVNLLGIGLHSGWFFGG